MFRGKQKRPNGTTTFSSLKRETCFDPVFLNARVVARRILSADDQDDFYMRRAAILFVKIAVRKFISLKRPRYLERRRLTPTLPLIWKKISATYLGCLRGNNT